ncbi:YdbH domain-containing protein [Azospirillum halopraeferens]|uniref:YdbH domain-containing protein n=1 Tax=Azospirillum halopraeferens TaxID=34010 RepID=UPI0012EC2AF1|nr:YdbH domain-containing protein [Azospirillum halopraeferens]
MRRLVAWLVILAAGAGLVAATWSDLLEGGATLALRRAGYPDARVTVVRAGVDWTRAAVRLDEALDLGIVTVLHPWRSLLDGHIERVVVSGAALTLDLTPGPDGDGGGAAEWGEIPVPPVGALAVTGSRLTLIGAGGVQTLSVAMTYTGGPEPELRADLRGEEAGADFGAVVRPLGDGRFTATVAGGIDDVGRLAPAVAGRLRIDGPVSGRLAEGVLRLSPDGCLAVTAQGLAPAGERTDLPEGLCLGAPAQGDALVLPLAGGPPAVRLAAEAPRLTVPGQELALDGVRVDATLEGGRLVAALTAGRLRSTAAPALFAPAALTARAEGPAGGALALSATVQGGQGLRIDATGRHDVASGEGRAELRLRPVTFSPAGAQPGALSPRLSGLVGAVAGTVAVRGDLAWGAKGLTTGGRLLLTDLAATAGPVAVAGVNGVLRLASLLPPAVAPGQEVAVKLLDVGLPLTDGVLRFGLDSAGVIGVERAEWRWAGGRVSARPFRLSLADPHGVLELEAAGLDLGAVLDLVELEGLAATGRLSGTIPVWLAGTAVRIAGAELAAEGGGTLRYDPATPPDFLRDGDAGSPTALLMGALTDFRYDSLTMTINGLAGGELTVGLAIRGSNPGFYDGYPVALNLKVSGALDRILRQSLDAYRIPDAVRDRMLQFDQ